jgi:hypothetical protein
MVSYIIHHERIRTLRRTGAQVHARARLEAWHERGLVSPALGRALSEIPEAYRPVAEAYQEMVEIAAGRAKAGVPRVEKAIRRFMRAFRRSQLLKRARDLDTVIAGAAKADAQEAKAIYDRSIAEAKDEGNLANLDHQAARLRAADAGSVLPAPMLGKQIRPTCTIHMLRSLLAAMGVQRRLVELVREAREILGDPYVGMTTAFTFEQQVKLFKHYGKHVEVEGRLFETMMTRRRKLQISIEIEDPIYKQSLILEEFNET